MGERVRQEDRDIETETLIFREKAERTSGQALKLLIISKMLFSNNTKMNRCA